MQPPAGPTRGPQPGEGGVRGGSRLTNGARRPTDTLDKVHL